MADTSSLKQHILLFGSRGMIGSALAKMFAGANLAAFGHQDLDITDYMAVERAFIKTRPEIVLNAAAFTRVDDCEKFRETAFVVNGRSPGHIAGLCKKYGSLLVHFSTDYIFDGKGETPYVEDHAANPINYYGTTKWEGEKRIVASGCAFLILRSSWIFGQNGDNFVKKLLKRALAGAKLQAPVDQTGAPTFATDVASAIMRLLTIKFSGLCHFTNSGSCSRYEQAKTILELYGLNNSVEAVKNEMVPSPAQRPHFSVLDISRYIETSGHVPRSWQQSTSEYIAFLKQNEHELRS